MNAKQNRQLAIQYHILRRLIQDDKRLHSKITKENIHELLDAKKFYEKYFEPNHNTIHIPTLFKLIQRETEAAFKRMSVKVHIIHKFDEHYPKSILQDFKEDAPMFIYLSGGIEVLDRKFKKISYFTTPISTDVYIQDTLNLIKELKGTNSIAIIQFNTLMDNIIFLELQKMNIPCIVIFRGPITKDLENSIKKYNPRFKRGLKGMNIMSITGPFNEVLSETVQTHLMNSMGHTSVLFSAVVADVNHEAIRNNLSWRKPSLMPLLNSSNYPSSDLLFTLEKVEDFTRIINQLIS